MRRMGFPDQWIRWMKVCISSATFSVLVNGEAKGYFCNSEVQDKGIFISSVVYYGHG
ncbi:hypothetical protein LINPERPRIM_LOCUS38522, partial [Linum perenne]